MHMWEMQRAGAFAIRRINAWKRGSHCLQSIDESRNGRDAFFDRVVLVVTHTPFRRGSYIALFRIQDDSTRRLR